MTHVHISASPLQSTRATLFTTATLPPVKRHMWLPSMPIPSVDSTTKRSLLCSDSASNAGSSPPPPSVNRYVTAYASSVIPPDAYQRGKDENSDEGRHGFSGFRKGLSPDQLRPIDAPTEPRVYYVESATSKRDGPRPAELYRVRSPSTSVSPQPDVQERFDASSVSDVAMRADDLGDDPRDGKSLSPPDATSLVARLQADRARRRSQNTLAARRSRARKLETMLKLETERDHALARVAELEGQLSNAMAEVAALRGRLNKLEGVVGG